MVKVGFIGDIVFGINDIPYLDAKNANEILYTIGINFLFALKVKSFYLGTGLFFNVNLGKSEYWKLEYNRSLPVYWYPFLTLKISRYQIGLYGIVIGWMPSKHFSIGMKFRFLPKSFFKYYQTRDYLYWTTIEEKSVPHFYWGFEINIGF